MTCFVDVFRPRAKTQKALVFDTLCVFCGSGFLALLAKIAIPLGGIPVPFTMQMVGVLMIGALLGSRKGALSVLLYLAEGACGLPVFYPGSLGLVGPSAGYLVGFVFCAYLVGFLLEKGWRHHYLKTVLAMALGTAVVWLSGASYLAFYLNVGIKGAFLMGVLPYLWQGGAKIALSASLVPSGWKFLQRFKKS